MALKKSEYVRAAELRTDNEERASARPASKDMKLAASEWLLTIASLMDAEATNEVEFVTLGRNRARDAFLLTVNRSNGTKQYIAGADTSDLGHHAFVELVDWQEGAPALG